MAEIKNFPNNADEYVYAQDVMKWHRPRTQGVYGADNNLSVAALATPAMAVTVSDGFAWLKDSKGNGCVCWNDNNEENGALLNLDIAAASSTQSRIDRVVMSWETAGYTEKPEIKVISGTPSSAPTSPAITNDGATRQISLARILIPAGATSITADLITDERLDGSVCGLVTESVSIDTSVMQNQFDALLLIYQTAIQSSIEGTIPPHSFTHGSNGTDPITPAEIGAVAEPTEITGSGAVAVVLKDNVLYSYTAVTSLDMVVNTNRAHGFITFAASISKISVTGAVTTSGDDINEAAGGETWEFDSLKGHIIWNKRGA